MEQYFKLGSQSIKGGILFGNLTPAGIFSNKPYQENLDLFLQYQNSTGIGNAQSADCNKKYLLTLEKLKESLQQELDSEITISDKLFKSFLTNSIQLLIDYNDVRNYIFYGSSYSELAYNILFLTKMFPYKAYLAKQNGSLTLNSLTNNRTEILLTKSEIKIGNEVYDLKEKNDIDYTKFLIEDKNGNTYKIVDFESPLYLSISNIIFSTVDTVIETNTLHLLNTGDLVKLKLSNNNKLNDSFYVEILSPTTFKIYFDKLRTVNVVINNPLIYDNEARVRLVQEPINYMGDYQIRIVVEGNINNSSLFQYTEGANIFNGLLIRRNKQFSFDFENNLTDLQKWLINKTIQKPWPRQIVTDNLLFQGAEFESWITDTGNFQYTFNYDEDGYGAYTNELELELSITSALYLDEEWTNQILRKTVPHYIIDELRDSEGIFKRFILMMAWFWDQIRLYINFISLNHHLNYSSYNQLSYRFYDLYAKHFGFNLFEEDNIELSRLILRTEPGLIYQNNVASFSDEENKKNLLLLQKEKQKRLLINLLFLYKKKGTIEGLNKLINLLGVPKDLIITNEYYLDFINKDSYGVPLDNNKIKKIDNNKVHTRKIDWAINFDKLKDKTNIDVLNNQPYFYDIKNDNDWKINLRELDLMTSPQDALLSDILYLSNKKFDFVEIKPGGFLSLQNNDNDYYLMPLSLPDKYIHFTANFLIEKESLGQKNRFDICSLFLVNDSIITNTPNIQPKGVKYNYFLERFGYYNVASFEILNSQQGDTISIISNTNILNNLTLLNDTDDENAKLISNSINTKNYNYKSTSIGNKIYIYANDMLLNDLLLTINCTATISSNEKFTSAFDTIQKDFIICRIENNNFVFRLKLKGETSIIFYDLICKSKSTVNDDGLLHNYKFLLRPKGIEIYKDLKFIEFVEFKDALTATSAALIPQYDSRVTPYEEIDSCDVLTDGIAELFQNPTNISEIRNWDLFCGDPRDIKVWVNKLGVFEDRDVNQESLLEYKQNIDNYNSEGYLLKPNILNENFDIYFSTEYPFITNQVSNYYLPFDNNNKIDKLNLNNFNNISSPNFYKNSIQQIFDNITTKEDLIKVCWEKNLHKTEEYNIFQNIVENYFEFNYNVIYYENLIPIIDLIERKFKLTAQQFIPVVINTNNFSELIQSETPDKYRYSNIYKRCNINNKGERARKKAFLLSQDNLMTTSDYITWQIDNLGTFVQNWEQSSFRTLYLLGEQIKSVSPNNISYIISKNNEIYIFIDCLWYFNSFNINVWDVSSQAAGNTPSLFFDESNWTQGVYGNGESTDCFEIEYATPQSLFQNNNFYIYDNNEHNINEYYMLIKNLPNEIYYDSEAGYNRFI